MKHDILKDMMCLYCSGRQFETPKKLQQHVLKQHPDTYASSAIKRRRIEVTT